MNQSDAETREKLVDTSPEFASLSQAVDALDSVRPAEGKPTFQFAFTLFRPGPWWPTNLDAFPVLPFDTAMSVPEGTGDNPFVIAVNEDRTPDVQALIVADYVISILRRQDVTAKVAKDEADITDLIDGIDQLDLLSKADAYALARAMRAGHRDEVAITLTRWGFGIQTCVFQPMLTRAAFAARTNFFAWCYNSLPVIRQSVDKVVAVTVGLGHRAVGPSEHVRRVVEQSTTDARTATFVAHAVRDSLLMGAGALVIDQSVGVPQVRVVRPDRLDLGNDRPNGQILESDETGIWRPVDALVIPGIEQRAPSYPASLLEPWSLSLATIARMRANADRFEATLPPENERSAAAASLAETVVVARDVANRAEGSLESHLSQLLSDFEQPNHPLYFPGHERWP